MSSKFFGNFNLSLLAALMLAIWLPWLYRYQIKPFFAKRKLKKVLASNPRLKTLLKIEKFLFEVYQGVNAKKISTNERVRLNIKDDSFVYGEVTFLAFFNILEKVKPKANEIFYDLGAGTGKPVLAAASFYKISKAYGVELLDGFVDKTNQLKNKAIELAKEKSLKLSSIEFIKHDFINLDFSNGDIIFINATCLDYNSWEKLQAKFQKLKVGSRVIVTTKKIESPDFKLISESFEIMSWGVNSVYIYKKI